MSVVDDSQAGNTADNRNKFKPDGKKPKQFKHYRSIGDDASAKNRNKKNPLTGLYFAKSTPRLPKIPETKAAADY